MQTQFGYMIFSPREGFQTGAGQDELIVYLPREDVQAGAGEVVLRSSTAARIALRGALKLNKTYAVTMTEGALTAGGGRLLSPALEDEKAWAFDTQVTFGLGAPRSISGEKADRAAAPSLDAPRVGDVTEIEVALGGEAASACLFGASLDAYEAETMVLAESGPLSLRWTSTGAQQWGVVFLNAAGEIIGGRSFVTEVIQNETAPLSKEAF